MNVLSFHFANTLFNMFRFSKFNCAENVLKHKELHRKVTKRQGIIYKKRDELHL